GWIVQQAGISSDLDPTQQRLLLEAACVAKEALTDSASASLSYAGWTGQLSREQFDALIEPMLARSLKACRRAVRDAGIELDEVEA
ncbi:Hsp70 family protein, partial [Brachybacterium paraconglomeratum]|nr:Hsp70 family protein [Brachybacterium paraconglomeratum]